MMIKDMKDITVQNDVKMMLIEVIENAKILSINSQTEVGDSVDDNGMPCRVDTGVRNISIRVRVRS